MGERGATCCAPTREIHSPRLRIAALPAESRRPATGALLAAVTPLSGGSTLAMGCVRGVLRVGLRRRWLPFGRVFCFGFCGGVLLMSGIPPCRCRVGFVGRPPRAPFFPFVFRSFLDAHGAWQVF